MLRLAIAAAFLLSLWSGAASAFRNDTVAGSDGAAAASALVNQIVEDGVTHTSLIVDSFLNNTGIVGVNQDSGNLNNQVNVVVVALAERDAAINLAHAGVEARRNDNQ